MKTFELKEGGVSIFRNTDPQRKEKAPDYTGMLKTPSGEELRIALWVSKNADGKNYFSGKVSTPNSGGERVTNKQEVDDMMKPAGGVSEVTTDDLPY